MQKAPSLCRLSKSQAKGTGQNDPRYHPASRIFLQRASEMRFDIRALSAHNACGRHRLPENRRITCGPKRAGIHPDSRLRFFPLTCAAPVGISETHVNLGRLSAGGPPSLGEANSLFSRSTQFPPLYITNSGKKQERNRYFICTAPIFDNPQEKKCKIWGYFVKIRLDKQPMQC